MIAVMKWEESYETQQKEDQLTKKKEPSITVYRYGFLMGDKGKAFTVFLPYLTVQTIQKTYTFQPPSGDVPLYERMAYERMDLVPWARNWLKEFHDGNEGSNEQWLGFHELSEIFLLARACAAHGQEQLALDLCNAANTRSREKEGKSFHQRLYKELAYNSLWSGINEIEDPHISRETVLASYRRILKKFPDSEEAPEAREMVQQLEKMVREDHKHPKTSPKPLDKLTVQQRIAELIYQLRDEYAFRPTREISDYLAKAARAVNW